MLTNGILISCICHFQSSSLCLFGFCLQVSSASNFCPDTRGQSSHLFRLTCSVVLRGGRLTANTTGVCGERSQCLGHPGFAPAHGVCAFMVYTAQAPSCSAGNCLRRALGCMPFRSLSRSGSGSWVLHRGTHSVGPTFCAIPGRSSSGDQVLGQRSLLRCGASFHLPGPSRLVSWCIHLRGLCVSSGELISGCSPPGRCQLSTISGSLWLETGSLHAVWYRMPSLGPTLPLSGCRPPASSLPLAGNGPARSH